MAERPPSPGTSTKNDSQLANFKVEIKQTESGDDNTLNIQIDILPVDGMDNQEFTVKDIQLKIDRTNARNVKIKFKEAGDEEKEKDSKAPSNPC